MQMHCPGGQANNPNVLIVNVMPVKSLLLQVSAIEVVAFAIEFVHLAIEFVALARKFVMTEEASRNQPPVSG